MNITSYNITDIGYHYIGLRVLAGLPPATPREDQTNTIARSVLKYVSDKALRLMLPEPKGTFETVGEKICQELVHFQFAQSARGTYELTESGREIVELLNKGRHVELRRRMVRIHLQTYDNLRAVVQRHFQLGSIWRPIVETGLVTRPGYIEGLLSPTFKGDAPSVAESVLSNTEGASPKKVEDALRERILRKTLPNLTIGEPLFRALTDRLISLRLLNMRREILPDGEFLKSYSPCVLAAADYPWYTQMDIPLATAQRFIFYYSEPNMTDEATQTSLLASIDGAFAALSPLAGYFNLPEVRDFVCERMRIPEAAFDEGVNYLLDRQPAPFTVGLQYEGISSRRKPLVRSREATQIYNLIRRT